MSYELIRDVAGGKAAFELFTETNSLNLAVSKPGDDVHYLCSAEDIISALDGKPNLNSKFYVFVSKAAGFVYVESRVDENVNVLLSKDEVDQFLSDYQGLVENN